MTGTAPIPAARELARHIGAESAAGEGVAPSATFADLNPGSPEVQPGALVEPALAEGNDPEPVQFERLGYFCRDRDSAPGKPVFNRTVGLRDTWAKVQKKG